MASFTALETLFTISISDNQLSILQQKLALTTLPDELPDSGWDYGVPLADIQRLLHYWKEKYDWRKHEAELNREMPQFTRHIEVDGGFGKINVHYVHKKSEVEGAIPLLIVHGCECSIVRSATENWKPREHCMLGPGSFFEVRKILPLLIQASPKHPSFHVVAISLPGFGFSSAPEKKGFSLPQYAEVRVPSLYAEQLYVEFHTSFYYAQGRSQVDACPWVR